MHNSDWLSSFQEINSCGPEVAALKRSIRRLENKLWIGNWQIKHLQTHKYFPPLQSTVSDAKSEIDWDRNVTADKTDMRQTTQLPAAGNLIVHDKG